MLCLQKKAADLVWLQRLKKEYQSGNSAIHNRRFRNKKHCKNIENISDNIIEKNHLTLLNQL